MHGKRIPQVHNSKEFLKDPNTFQLGSEIAIIGMDKTSVSVARTALRKGVRHVTLYSRSKRITASMHDFMSAKLEGADFVFGKEVIAITGTGPLFKTAIFDENNKVIGFKPELEQIEVDSIIM